MSMLDQDDIFKKLLQVYADTDIGKEPTRRSVCKYLYIHAEGGPSRYYYLGRLMDREEELGPVNFFPRAMQAALKDCKAGDTSVSNQAQTGQVLGMHDHDWSIAANDAWMIGGIHGGKEYILMGSDPAKIGTADSKAALLKIALSGKKEHPLSVTGREILGLAMFGYGLNGRTGDGRLKFKCVDSRKAQGANFSAYHETIKRIEEALRNNDQTEMRNTLAFLGK